MSEFPPPDIVISSPQSASETHGKSALVSKRRKTRRLSVKNEEVSVWFTLCIARWETMDRKVLLRSRQANHENAGAKKQDQPQTGRDDAGRSGPPTQPEPVSQSWSGRKVC